MEFTDLEFDATAAAWENPDWVSCALHAYRVRWGAAERDPRSDELDSRLETLPPIRIPTTNVHGTNDGASRVESSAGPAANFTAFYERRVLRGIGHFIPREDPTTVFEAVDRLITAGSDRE